MSFSGGGFRQLVYATWEKGARLFLRETTDKNRSNREKIIARSITPGDTVCLARFTTKE